MWNFLFDILKIIIGVFSFTTLMAVMEWLRTTNRLKKEVKKYIESGEYEWKNQTEEFAFMHRVRKFEVLLRNVRALQPRTPLAYKRVEEVRDKLEFFHTAIPIFRGEHLPLAKIGEFPFQPPTTENEALVRQEVLKRLSALKWLGVKSQPSNE